MEQISSKLFNWASDIDGNTLAQAELTSQLPFVFPHVALMPDAHSGKGATVGSVIPTLHAVIPAAVGVDIGCGMIAVRTQFKVEDLPADRSIVRERIEQAIPLSSGHYNDHITDSARKRLAKLSDMADSTGFDPSTYVSDWGVQLGSLGAGNHFIEISADEDDNVWLFLHSGSRGIGNKLAQHHIKIAQKLCDKWWIQLPQDDLAYLVESTPEFDQYMKELNWAQHFALMNRAEMMDRVAHAMELWMGQPVQRLETIQCHHNYTNVEEHYGKKLIVSRKGAIDAHTGIPGLIPGSMGTASYIVEGKGFEPSLCSAPHGAGRDYSRSAARKAFSMEQLETAMAGIEWHHSDEFIDEIPQAYKDIDTVMHDSRDLVAIKHMLHQLVNVKGN
jgi:tRNA-splicing ligase RtcB